MAHYNLIKDGKVVNTIVADNAFVKKLTESGEYDSVEEVVHEPAPSGPLIWYVDMFREHLSFEERVAWDNGTVPEMVTIKNDFGGAKFTDEVLEYANILLNIEAISQETYDAIAAVDPAE